MTGARIEVKFDDKDFAAAVQKMGGVIKTSGLRAIGSALVEVTQKRFDTGTEPYGAKWHPLNPAYAMIKKGPGILRASLQLQRSVTFQTRGSDITIGSNRIYAAVHQSGATIKPVNAKALVFRLGISGPRGGKGSGIVRAKSVTIPARPYLGFGPNDYRAVMEKTAELVSTVFSA